MAEAHRIAALKRWEGPERQQRLDKLAESRKAAQRAVTKHGGYKTPEYQAWVSIRLRCAEGGVYHGRIKVCSRWASPDSFPEFLADMGRRSSPRHEIDRIDNDGDYEPGNCCWATRQQQMRNTSQNVNIAIGDKTMCAQAWSDVSGVPAHMIRRRIHDGWPAARAVYEPRNENVVAKRPRNRFS